jgi:OOP family OmpA-OmpF porin
MINKLLITFLLSSVISFSQNLTEQETTKDSVKETIKGTEKRYNKWSIEFNTGMNKPIAPFADGYYYTSVNNVKYFNRLFNHYDLGVRYMISPTFGFKLDLGYDTYGSNSQSESLPFEGYQIRTSFQGVINLGRLLSFESFTNRLSALVHLGPVIGIQKSETGGFGMDEKNGGLIIGFTPQYKLSNRIVATLDFSNLVYTRKHITWDGNDLGEKSNHYATMFNLSAGITVYLGKQKEHADWYSKKEKERNFETELSDANARIDELEMMLQDIDRDGVPDYRDVEPNTIGGVKIDTKGRSIDVNDNGVPDELEDDNSGRADLNAAITKSKSSGYLGLDGNSVFEAMLKQNLINIFYDINQDTPNSSSANNVYMILQFLKKYPESKIKMTGYADVTGSESYNKELSARRAKKLKDFFIQSGIDNSRLIDQGLGNESEIKGNDFTSKLLSRRVSIELIE